MKLLVKELQDAAAVLSSLPDGEWPVDVLLKAKFAACQLGTRLAIVTPGGSEFFRLWNLVWGSVHSRTSVLLLLAAATRSLLSTFRTPRKREAIECLHISIGKLVYHSIGSTVVALSPQASYHHVKDTILTIAHLAAKMGFFKTTSALLAAARNAPQSQLLQLSNHDMCICIIAELMTAVTSDGRSCGVLKPLQLRLSKEASKSNQDCVSVHAGPGIFDAQTRKKIMEDMVQALVDSSVVEHCVRSLLLPAEQQQGELLPAMVSSTTTTNAKVEDPRMMWIPGSLSSILIAVGTLIKGAVDHEVGGRIFTGSTDDGMPSGSGEGQGATSSDRCGTRIYIGGDGYELLRTLLAGRNLQFGIAAYVVSQLAALDGGPSYGLDADPRMRARAEASINPGDSGIKGGRYSRGKFMSLIGSFTSWSMCNFLSVPFPLYSSTVVLKLSFRALRLVAAATADFVSECQRQRGEAKAAALQQVVHVCAQLAVIVIECAQSTLKQLKRQHELGTKEEAQVQVMVAGGSGGQHMTGQALDQQFWDLVVPVVHGMIDLGELGLIPIYLPMQLMDKAAGVPLSHGSITQLKMPQGLWFGSSAGAIPLLERGARAHSRLGANPLFSLTMLFCPWPRFGSLLAYGEPVQLAALMSTATKLLRRLLGDRRTAASGSNEGSGRKGDGARTSRLLDDLSPEELEDVLALLPMSNLLDMLTSCCLALKADCSAAQRARQRDNIAAITPQPTVAAAALVSEVSADVALKIVYNGGDGSNSGSSGVNGGNDGCGGSPLLLGIATPQLLHMTWLAAQQWLPLMAQCSLALLQQEPPASLEMTRFAIGLACEVMAWVPSLSQAYATGVEDAGQRVCGAADTITTANAPPATTTATTKTCRGNHIQPPQQPIPPRPFKAQQEQQPGVSCCSSGCHSPKLRLLCVDSIRQLVMEELQVTSLILLTVQRLQDLMPARGQSIEAQRSLAPLLALLQFTSDCVVQAFGSDAGLIGYTLLSNDMLRDALPHLRKADALLGPLDSSPTLRLLRTLRILHNPSTDPFVSSKSRRPGLPKSGQAYLEAFATATLVGGLLRIAPSLAPPGLATSPSGCGNPCCTNLAGPSDFSLQLTHTCRRCRAVSYCGAECQWMHWKHGGHQAMCGTLGTETGA
ncbi:hypothetical protein Vafri_4679 [Volvox africanus]|uniref:phytol kinase n=1 Tax=Volvox africanus TaxID=51714 RepID=A0A8J4AVR0_9CHLO|nr:hypothetical protein Vafri_4679 [Volvox africanus]